MWWILWACGGAPVPGASPVVASEASVVSEAPVASGAPVEPAEAAAQLPVEAATSGPPEAAVDALPACPREGGVLGDAQAHNIAGMRCYDRGEHGLAAQHFRDALALDETHVLAHYNLACTLALLRSRGGEAICINDAYVDTILTLLETSVRLDEGRRARIAEDADLVSVHNTVRFQVLLGRDMTRPAVLEARLPGMVLYSPVSGAFGHALEVHLHADGEATWRTWTLADDGSRGPWKETSATWLASAPSQITLEGPDGVWVLDVEGDGTFRPQGGDGVRLTDHPEECSA